MLWICTATEQLSSLNNHYARKKCHNRKNNHFEKKCPKIKKRVFPLITTFYNLTFKTETSWAKKVVKSILDTWNVSDVIVYVWFAMQSKQKYAM